MLYNLGQGWYEDDHLKKIILKDYLTKTISKTPNKEAEILNSNLFNEFKEKYPNLFNSELIQFFRKYTNEKKELGKRKSPNFGVRYITEDFKNWLKSANKNSDGLLKKVNAILDKKELINFIIDLINITNLNQGQIVEVLDNFGLLFKNETIRNVALRYIFNNNKKLVSKRFPKSIKRKKFAQIKDLPRDYALSNEDNSNYIKSFKEGFKISEELILVICSMIYKEILRKNKSFQNGKNKSELNKIEKHILVWLEKNDIGQKFQERKEELNKFLKKFVRDLVEIVYKFNYHNVNTQEMINMKQFAKKLIETGYDLNYSLGTLRRTLLPQIFEHLNSEFKQFDLQKIEKRKLEKDESGKVCGRCSKKKPYEDFQLVDNSYYSSRCKKCLHEYPEILKFRKKIRLLFELYNGKYNGKCSNPDCKSNFLLLPAFDFHHPNEKKFEWKKLHKKAYSIIKKLFEKDGAVPLCNNCHEPHQQTILKDYEKLILNQYLFFDKTGKKRTGKEINKMIDKAIQNHPKLEEMLEKDPQYIGHIKYMIKSWIRKRAVIEQLYEGKCGNCGETFLGALTFHHLEPSKKDKMSSIAFRHYSIEELVKMLIEEECTCLCANCHSMIEATIFMDNYEEILKEVESFEKSAEKIKGYYEKLKNFLKKEQNRLKNLKQNKFEAIDYLKKSFKFVWEKYLFIASILIKLKEKNEFTSKEIEILPESVVSTHITYLSIHGYIQKIKKVKWNIYKITEKGKLKVNKIKKNVKLNGIDVVNEFKKQLNKRRENKKK